MGQTAGKTRLVQMDTLVSLDLLTEPTVFFDVLYVFVVLAHHRRRIIHVNVTTNPGAQ